MWDTTTHDEHFRGRPQEGNIFSEEGTIALIDNRRRIVIIGGMGYAIGHYARWLRPGSRRVEAASSDVLVQVTAFRDNTRKRLVWVVINNSRSPRIVRFRTNGLRLVAGLAGEQSTAAARWRKLRRVLARSTFTVTLPAESVTTLERRFA
jgi:O-glycosyl hydrolase